MERTPLSLIQQVPKITVCDSNARWPNTRRYFRLILVRGPVRWRISWRNRFSFSKIRTRPNAAVPSDGSGLERRFDVLRGPTDQKCVPIRGARKVH